MSTAEMEQLTSGASNRIIPILKTLRASLIFVYTLLISLILFILPLRPRRLSPSTVVPLTQTPPSKFSKRRMEDDDTARRRALAENLDMGFETRDGECRCRWSTFLFSGVRGNALFCRSWVPVSAELKGILIIIHGLNEHSGRYAHFARQLTSSNFGVYAMDWIGHGGSDGLHGYVPSLDHVVADTAVAPIFSLVAPKFQFKGANKRGIPVSRDPEALLAKYSDPLVYTGPIRVRTGHEILRISSYLMRNFRSVTVPFLVLHGTADKVTDPLASKDLYNEAASELKNIKLYDGFLHDLLFEPEREEIAQDIIAWMEKRLGAGLGNVGNIW
ncbi:monoacylglycerol lipase isoform X6 [Juglans microcarpa x Juglans regia]|uniref:monoacylglycerol lipase isoform X6 n=1 Tax=Juglans microcarpa x Juglans regia TaxID=2249226 RepID=UPI001B7F680B|nr:monoacylglycerol lipase isoform X6 [Juglans microcarpa x Juglans regia]